MKTFKRIFAIVLSAVMIVTLSGMKDVKAYADDAVTWTVYYDGGSGKYVVNSARLGYWSEGIEFIDQYMVEGDNIVVDAHGEAGTPMITITVSKRIGQAVAKDGAIAYFKAPTVDYAYVATSGTIIVEATTTKAVDVYPGQVVQIFGNVDKFVAYYKDGGPAYPRFGVTGTVKEAYVNYTGSVYSADKPVYNVAANTLNSDEYGRVSLAEGKYSLTATVEAPAKKKQLDAVPKTGAETVPESLVFFALAAVFAIGAVAFKKKLQ